MNKTDLSQYRNDDYHPGPALKRGLWYLTSMVFFQTAIPWPSAMKRTLLRAFGARVGRGVVIKPVVQIKYPWFLTVGDHVWLGERVWIDNLAEVTIGSHACLSQGAMLLTGNHNYTRPTFDLMTRPIHVADGAWIGAKAVVCPGVRVGSHAVLTVGSVAIRDLEEYGIHSGHPAAKTATRRIS